MATWAKHASCSEQTTNHHETNIIINQSNNQETKQTPTSVDIRHQQTKVHDAHHQSSNTVAINHVVETNKHVINHSTVPAVIIETKTVATVTKR